MAGFEFITATNFYNLLNQSFLYADVSDPTFLVLFDTRPKADYEESHIFTAKRLKRNEENDLILPFDAELQCKEHVVVYDNCCELEEDVDAPAMKAATFLSNSGSRNPVKILKGGYEFFSAQYPFLRTQKILFMPREMDEIKTYPLEVIPKFLYIGSKAQADLPYVKKDLKIRAYLNCSAIVDKSFQSPGLDILEVNLNDDEEEDLLSSLSYCCAFLDGHREQGKRVLIYSELGIGRCVSIAMAYLIHTRQFLLLSSYNYLREVNCRMCPNHGHLEQLSVFEEKIYGKKITDLNTLEL